jgi:hypothetical protein
LVQPLVITPVITTELAPDSDPWDFTPFLPKKSLEAKSMAESPDFDQISGPILWEGNPPEGPTKIT